MADISPYGMHRLADHGILPWLRDVGPSRIKARLDGFLLDRTQLTWGQTALPSTYAPWRPDVVLAWSERGGIPAVARETVSRRCAPVVSGAIWVTEHASRTTRAARRWLPGCASIFALSTGQLEPLQQLLGRRGPAATYVPFGVDTTYFTPVDGGVTAAPVLPAEVDQLLAKHPVVMSVGNDGSRDHKTLAAAISLTNAMTKGEPRSVRLLLASRLGAQIPLDVGLQISNLTANQLLIALRRSTIFVVTTRPNLHVSGVTALLEAMSVGLPVVASRTPGMAEYIQHGETGLLVECGDEQGLARALRELLSDPDRATSLGAAASRQVRRENDVALMQARLADILWAV